MAKTKLPGNRSILERLTDTADGLGNDGAVSISVKDLRWLLDHADEKKAAKKKPARQAGNNKPTDSKGDDQNEPPKTEDTPPAG